MHAARWRHACTAAPLFTLLGLVTFATAGGCGSPDATCDCADPQVTISIPEDIAASVTSVTLLGPACTNVQPTASNMLNGGTTYAFVATAANTCTITVAHAGETFTDTITFTQTTGCCAGFYASPLSAAQVDVPEPGDAG
jgi:hypothetical protein